ncbi:MAG: sigma-54 dependent transcriptional regulator [Pseudomonadota bacterium]
MAKTTIRVAIVDDEADMRQSISQWLTLSGFETVTYASAVDALKVLRTDTPTVVVSDIRMPGIDGITFLKKLMHEDSGIPVILITGHGDVPMAVEAMQIGAWDFMEKPFDPDRLSDLVRKAIEARRTSLENRALRDELSDGPSLVGRLAGSSPEIAQLREDILDIGQSPLPVLIQGETGTGKTLVARALHAVGPHSQHQTMHHFLGLIPTDKHVESLFGTPDAPETGMLDKAAGGTLIIEDVETLSNDAQAQMVAWLNSDVPGAPRIISVCNAQDVNKGCEAVLSPVLFHRISQHRLVLPPLRARGDDILKLFVEMMRRAGEEYGCQPPTLSAQDAAQLMKAPWPGNIRQLSNMADRAVLQTRKENGTLTSLLMADNEVINSPAMIDEGKPLKEYVEAFERMLIDNTMRKHRGSIARVMEELCLPRRTLNEKMAKYALQRADYLD